MTKNLLPVSRHNYFSGLVLANQEAFVRKWRKALKDEDFDTFVVRGMSGAIAGGILARSLKKNLFVIRKESDNSHDGSPAFGTMGSRWVFLDDFVSSGATFFEVWDFIQKEFGTEHDYDASLGGWVTLDTPERIPDIAGALVYRDGWYPTDQFRDQYLYGRCYGKFANRVQEVK